MRILTSTLAVLFMAGTAQAADLKCAQIKLVVPYTAGGATDVAARLVAKNIEPLLKIPTVIETRTGATGNIGTAVVANSTPPIPTASKASATILSRTSQRSAALA
jgi:tripartite-type tricarboxylate transporter receptor subunit TctC